MVRAGLSLILSFGLSLPVAALAGERLLIDREEYRDRLQGFWLGQSIANWSGLVTEMDKIGNIGPIKTGDFYNREDWGQPDQPSIWGQGVPSDLSPTIDFVFVDTDGVWGSDDDTDIEYIYQHLLEKHQTSLLSPEQIRDGWLTHIYPSDEPTPYGQDPDGNYENYLWVSNQRAHDLMRQGILPPETGSRENNEHYDMIDAQLTTEIFGLFAPARPDLALRMADLPIRTSADGPAAEIARFYVVLHSLAGGIEKGQPDGRSLRLMAERAREVLSPGGYPAAMYEFVKRQYDSGVSWEAARDAVYQRYQVEQADGYDITARELYCNGCFAAGINFAASLVSFFYGEGDIKETLKIAILAGWDSDNPAATWGGLLGFMLGKRGVEEAFGRTFSDRFNIHRTRRNFASDGVDTFENMALVGVSIVDRVVQQQIGGTVSGSHWLVPAPVGLADK